MGQKSSVEVVNKSDKEVSDVTKNEMLNTVLDIVSFNLEASFKSGLDIEKNVLDEVQFVEKIRIDALTLI